MSLQEHKVVTYCSGRVRFSVLPRYYNDIKCGAKTVEGRPYYKCYHAIDVDDIVEIVNSVSKETFLARIVTKQVFSGFREMLKGKTVKACLPGHEDATLDEAVQVYHSFMDGDYERLAARYGVVGFCLQVVDKAACTAGIKLTYTLSLCSLAHIVCKKL